MTSINRPLSIFQKLVLIHQKSSYFFKTGKFSFFFFFSKTGAIIVVCEINPILFSQKFFGLYFKEFWRVLKFFFGKFANFSTNFPGRPYALLSLSPSFSSSTTYSTHHPPVDKFWFNLRLERMVFKILRKYIF